LTRACACETEMRRCAHVTVNRLLWMWTGFSECEWVCACECGRWMCEVRECERCQFLCVNVNSAWMWKVSVFLYINGVCLSVNFTEASIHFTEASVHFIF
jgi:hypothetical protein